jgi:uncharacterized protein
MIWSKYGHLFQSRRNGWLLYNSAANSFLQVEEGLLPSLRELQKDADSFDFSRLPQLYLILRQYGFLVEDDQDEKLYNVLKMNRLTANYATKTLMLTVAITRNCNFDCSYCYEGNRSGSAMSEAVVDQLISFIRLHTGLKSLSIVWYGGEPLLAIDRIRLITKKVETMDKKYGAGLVTNGYLLTKEISEELNDLHIEWIQITLDGKKETHDGRRYLKTGGPTYDRIMQNLESLMQSSYKGTVSIRVNVDSRNEDEFIEVYRQIHDRFPEEYGKRIYVYPGFVKGDEHPDVSCFFDSDEKGRFIAATCEKYGVEALATFPRKPVVGCTLTKRNAYVVGPDGELYKCWDDVGVESLVVGHIDRLDNWNMGLIAEGMTACSYLDSSECKECFYFPICDGGCHKVRMRNLHDDKKRDCCSYFKNHLDELLELHYEQKKQHEEKTAQEQ